MTIHLPNPGLWVKPSPVGNAGKTRPGIYWAMQLILGNRRYIIKVKKDCLWKQRTHKITEIRDWFD